LCCNLFLNSRLIKLTAHSVLNLGQRPDFCDVNSVACKDWNFFARVPFEFRYMLFHVHFRLQAAIFNVPLTLTWESSTQPSLPVLSVHIGLNYFENLSFISSMFDGSIRNLQKRTAKFQGATEILK